MTCPLTTLVHLYRVQIIKLYVVPREIVSNRDLRFMSVFWTLLQRELGIETRFSITYHPQMDGLSEQMIQIIEDLLISCVLNFDDSQDEHLLLVELAYNNNYQVIIDMALFEVLYGRPCKSPTCLLEDGHLLAIGQEMLRDSQRVFKTIYQCLKPTQARQHSYAGQRRREVNFAFGDPIFLKFFPTKGSVRFGKQGKLSPKYVSLFEVLERVGEVTQRLALPPSL